MRAMGPQGAFPGRAHGEVRIMAKRFAAILSAAAIGILAPAAHAAGLDMGS